MGWSEFWGGVKDTVETAVNAVKHEAETVVEPAVGGFINNIKNIATQAVNKVEKTEEKIENTASDVVHKVADTASNIANKVADTASNVVDKVGNSVESIAGGAASLLNSLPIIIGGVAVVAVVFLMSNGKSQNYRKRIAHEYGHFARLPKQPRIYSTGFKGY